MQKAGRIYYVEPNEIATGGKIPNTPFNMEDLNMGVDLIVRVPSRLTPVDEGESTFIASYGGGNDISFFRGSEIAPGTNMLTSFYGDLDYSAFSSEGSKVEGLGISSIDVEYNSWMYPNVTIKFVDVRGVSLMMPSEMKAADRNRNGSTDYAGSFFSAFFSFPYPKFTLKFKGFYGKAVSLDLCVEDFRAAFNSELGCFEATVKFIGYMYGCLTDIPMKYLLVAPYVDYVGKRLWDSMDQRFQGGLNNGEAIPTYIQILEKLNDINPEKINSTFNSNAVGKSYNEINSEVVLLRTIKEKYNDCFETESYGGDILVEEKPNSSEFIFSKSDKTKFKSEEIDDLKFRFSSLFTVLSDYNENPDHNTKLPLVEGLGNKDDLMTKISSWFNQDEKAMDKGFIGTMDEMGLGKKISGILTNKEAEFTTVKNNLAEAQKEISQNILGFVPTINNIMQVNLAHLKCFLKLMFNCIDDIRNSNRKVAEVKGRTDVKGNSSSTRKSDLFLPPFFSAYDNDGKEIWVGNVNSNLDEVHLVDGFINGLEMKESDFQRTINLSARNYESGKNYIYLPTMPLDFFFNITGEHSNPYKGINVYGQDGIWDVLSTFALRSVIFNETTMDKSAVDFGKAEAYLFYDYWNNQGMKIAEELSKINLDYETFISGGIKSAVHKPNEMVGKRIYDIWQYIWKHTSDEDYYLPVVWDTISEANGIEYNEEECIGASERKYKGVDYKWEAVIVANEIQCEKIKSIKNNILADSNIDFEKKTFYDNIFLTEDNDTFSECYCDESDLDGLYYVTNDGTKKDGVFTESVDVSLKSKDFVDNWRYNHLQFGAISEKGKKNTDAPSLFGHGFYRAQKSDELKAALFLISMGFKVPVFSITPSPSILKNGKAIRICPYAYLCYLGAIIWLCEYDKNNIIWKYKRIREEGEDEYDSTEDKEFKKFKENQYYIIDYKSKAYDVTNFYNLLQDISTKNRLRSCFLSFCKNEWNDFRQLEIDVDHPDTKYNGNHYVKSEIKLMNSGDGYRLPFNNDDTLVKKLVKFKLRHALLYKKRGDWATKYDNYTFMDFMKQSFNNFKETLVKKLYSGSDNAEATGERTVTTAKVKSSKKLAMYRNFKTLYDKWLGNKTCEVMLNEFNDKFRYIDAYYNDIGDKLIINMDKMLDSINVLNTPGNEDMSFYQFISDLCWKNNVTLLAYPMDITQNLKSFRNMEEVFTPMSKWAEARDEASGYSFICIYTGESSKHLNMGGNSEYEDDGFSVKPSDNGGIGGDNCDIIPSVFGSGADSEGYYVPAFGVSYGRQNQSYFKNVQVSMDNPMITEQYISSLQNIIKKGSDANPKPDFSGQDLFDIYSNHSYTCNFDMLGCAQIMPLMYFQLNNIPMFKGAYMITTVKHNITPGNFMTSVTGVRQSRNSLPYNMDFVDIGNLSDPGAYGSMVDDVVFNSKAYDLYEGFFYEKQTVVGVPTFKEASEYIDFAISKENYENARPALKIFVVMLAKEMMCSGNFRRKLRITSMWRNNGNNSFHNDGLAVDMNWNDKEREIENNKLFEFIIRYHYDAIDQLIWEPTTFINGTHSEYPDSCIHLSINDGSRTKTNNGKPRHEMFISNGAGLADGQTFNSRKPKKSDFLKDLKEPVVMSNFKENVHGFIPKTFGRMCALAKEKGMERGLLNFQNVTSDVRDLFFAWSKQEA